MLSLSEAFNSHVTAFDFAAWDVDGIPIKDSDFFLR